MLLRMLKQAFNSSSRSLSGSDNETAQAGAGAAQPVPLPAPGRHLHIGGNLVQSGWEVFDAQARAGVDHVGDAADLARFPNEAFTAIYASHVLEHFEYFRVVPVLREWSRVLARGGFLYLSVPDLDVLCGVILDKRAANLQQRFDVMRIMFGGQIDQWDYHKVGLNEELLADFLKQAGLAPLRRVDDFGFFADSSTLKVAQRAISLNLIAVKP